MAKDPAPNTRRAAKESQRWRLLEAMARVVGQKGYAQTSVTDVITEAGVSRKAFYEYFRDKEAAFLEAYESLSDRFVRALDERARGTPPDARVEVLISAYLEVLSRDVWLARAFMIEVLAAGAAAWAMREEVNQRFASLTFGRVTRDPLIRKALSAGINDVVAGALLSGQHDVRPLRRGLLRFVASSLPSRSTTPRRRSSPVRSAGRRSRVAPSPRFESSER